MTENPARNIWPTGRGFCVKSLPAGLLSLFVVTMLAGCGGLGSGSLGGNSASLVPSIQPPSGRQETGMQTTDRTTSNQRAAGAQDARSAKNQDKAGSPSREKGGRLMAAVASLPPEPVRKPYIKIRDIKIRANKNISAASENAGRKNVASRLANANAKAKGQGVASGLIPQGGKSLVKTAGSAVGNRVYKQVDPARDPEQPTRSESAREAPSVAMATGPVQIIPVQIIPVSVPKAVEEPVVESELPQKTETKQRAGKDNAKMAPASDFSGFGAASHRFSGQ